MSVPTSRRQENRLLPYLAAILAVLLAYVVYTRVIQRPAPVAVLTPVPVETTPSPAATATPQVARSPQPSMAAEIPARPIGRSNPFVPLVVPPTPPPAPAPRAAAPPPLPPVPPPVFPEAPAGTQPGAGPPQAQPAPTPTPLPTPTLPPLRVAGILIREDQRLAVLQVGEQSYIVGVGNLVEGFRVIRIEDDLVVLRRGPMEIPLRIPRPEVGETAQRR